jgi:hypothetical protein
MNPNPDDLRASAAECRKRAEKASPANGALWFQIGTAYSSLAEEAEGIPARRTGRTQG